MKAFCLRFDAWFQRRFDAVVHWTMLTFGVSKGAIRWTLWSFQIARMFAEGALYLRRGEVGTTVFNLVMAALMGWIQSSNMRADAEAERRGMMSLKDRSCATLRVFWWVNVALYILLMATQKSPLDLMAWLGFSGLLGWLSLEYLCRTHPRPPERSVRKCEDLRETFKPKPEGI